MGDTAIERDMMEGRATFDRDIMGRRSAVERDLMGDALLGRKRGESFLDEKGGLSKGQETWKGGRNMTSHCFFGKTVLLISCLCKMNHSNSCYS